MAVPALDPPTFEALCAVLGDTEGGLTGSEISTLLGQCDIADVAPAITKRHRLFEALAARQARDRVATVATCPRSAPGASPPGRRTRRGAHELNARWAVDEREVLDLLTMVSVIHRRLETAVPVLPRPAA
jgi:hypothetical protein